MSKMQTSRQQAVSAFARRKKLTKSQRLNLAKAFRPMSKRVAWAVAKAYGLGQLDEVGEQLERLVRAWLVLGGRRFGIIFRVIRVIHVAVVAGLEALDELFRKLREIIPYVSRRQVLREVEFAKQQLSHVVVFPV